MPVYRSWSGGFEAAFDQEVTPDSLTVLISAVSNLSVQNGDRVHAQGSKWAFSAPAYCENTMINTDRLCNFPTSIQLAIDEPIVDGKLRIAVEAGIKVYDLYNALAGRNDPTENPPVRRFGGGTITSIPIDHDRWMLPVLGGAGGQSIAGAINTGTHGGDAQRPPLSDAVAAMLIVGTGGVLRLIQRQAADQHPPIVNAARLSASLGISVQDIQDDETLQAAVLSVGRFGVVYAYVLEVVDEGDIRIVETRTKGDWATERATLIDKVAAASRNDEFLQIVINPNRRADGNHTCYVTQHFKVPVAVAVELVHVRLARTPGSFMAFFQSLCADHVTPEIETARIVLASLIPLRAPTAGIIPALLPPPFNTLGVLLPLALPVVIGLIANAIACLGRISPTYLVGDAIADILNSATDIGFPIVGEYITGLLLDGEQKDKIDPSLVGGTERPWKVWGTRFEIADFFDYDHDCYKGDSVEVFFEVNSDLPDKVDALLDIFDQLRDMRFPFGGYVSLRFMAQSGAHLALSRWPTTCSVEIAAIRGLRGTLFALQEAQRIALGNDGVVHWGQQNDLMRPAIESSFRSSLVNWRQRLREIEGTSLRLM